MDKKFSMGGINLHDPEFLGGTHPGIVEDGLFNGGGSGPMPKRVIAGGDINEPFEEPNMSRQTGIINKDTNQWAENGEYQAAQRSVQNAKSAQAAGSKVPGASTEESGKRLQAAEATLSKFGKGTQYQLDGTDEGQGVDLSRSAKMFPGNVTLPGDQASALKGELVDKTYAQPVREYQGFSQDKHEAEQQQSLVRDFTAKAGGLATRLTSPDGVQVLAQGPEDYPSIKAYLDGGGTAEKYAEAKKTLNSPESYAAAFGPGAIRTAPANPVAPPDAPVPQITDPLEKE